MIDLGRLRALRAVSAFGTVTAAADALHVTPSAVSQHLTKLERETGSTLVEKDGRGLRLTEAGRLLADHADRVLAAVEEAEAALAAHHSTVSGPVTVASFPTACRSLLPYALRRLGTDHPTLRPGLVECDRAASLDRLQRGSADVAVYDEWPDAPATIPPGVSTVDLGRDIADVVLYAHHPLARGRGPVRMDDLRHDRWIASLPGSVCHEWLLRLLPGVRPEFLVAEFETQFRFVAEGLGVAYAPRLALPDVLPDGVVVRPITPVSARRVIVAWRSSTATRPAIGATVEALRAAWRARGTTRAER